jgi:hypothetical protein
VKVERVVVAEVEEGCDRHVRGATGSEARRYGASSERYWQLVLELAEASARCEAVRRRSRVRVSGCDRGLKGVGVWKSGQQLSGRLSRRISLEELLQDRARCCRRRMELVGWLYTKRHADSGEHHGSS